MSSPSAKDGGRPSQVRLYGLLLLMTLFWALNYIVGKVALREFPSVLLAMLRTTLAGLFLIPVYACSGRGEVSPWKWRELRMLVTLGSFGVAMNQFFFVTGLARTSVAHASFTMSLMPILVLGIACLAGQERLRAVKLAGMGIALAGVILIEASRGNTAGATAWGDFLIFLSALGFAVFTVFGKRITNRHGAVTVTTFAYVSGAIAFAPFTIWQGARFSFVHVSGAAWASLVFMAVIPSAICYLIYYWALGYIAASRVSAFSYLQPLGATLMAVPLLGETLTAPVVAGGALVLAGVALVERL